MPLCGSKWCVDRKNRFLAQIVPLAENAAAIPVGMI